MKHPPILSVEPTQMPQLMSTDENWRTIGVTALPHGWRARFDDFGFLDTPVVLLQEHYSDTAHLKRTRMDGDEEHFTQQRACTQPFATRVVFACAVSDGDLVPAMSMDGYVDIVPPTPNRNFVS